MKHAWSILMALVFCTVSFVTCYAFASTVEPQDFFAQMLEVIKNFGGLSTMAKISSVILLIVASMKVTALSGLWDKLGNFKAWLAPALGLVAGIIGIGHDGPITLASVMVYISAGGGAVILHELLDSLKSVPGIGPTYLTIINIIQSVLGGKKQ